MSETLPFQAYAAALAGLPGAGPATLVDLLNRHDPQTAWELVLSGDERRPARTITKTTSCPDWVSVAGRVDVAARWRRMQTKGIGVTYIGRSDYPAALENDPLPAGVLFSLGDITTVGGPCVAVVGTRRSTGYGRSAAFEIARDLANCGVCVVSGLALGIDGAAHTGALAASNATHTAGIAASGVDCPYPRRHLDLWARVAKAGAVISETPPGQAAQAWRFPSRNRIIAGLSQAVVVIESAEGGGSMLTVQSAIDRGIPVLAVPGPVNSPVSSGPNRLIFEGAYPARHAGDVLAAIGDLRPWPPPPTDPADPTDPNGATSTTQSTLLDEPTRQVLAAIDWTPTPTAVIAARTGRPLTELGAALVRLEDQGLIAGDMSTWERRK